MSAGMKPPPPGSALCPHCARPVMAGAPFCPHCGFRLLYGAGPRPLGRGVRCMIGGLITCGVAGFAFFASCLGMLGSGGGGDWIGIVLGITSVIGLAGLVVILIGFAMTMVEMLRR